MCWLSSCLEFLYALASIFYWSPFVLSSITLSPIIVIVYSFPKYDILCLYNAIFPNSRIWDDWPFCSAVFDLYPFSFFVITYISRPTPLLCRVYIPLSSFIVCISFVVRWFSFYIVWLIFENDFVYLEYTLLVHATLLPSTHW